MRICGKSVDFFDDIKGEIFECEKCGNHVCKDCFRSGGGLCPHCFGRLLRIS